MRRKEAAWRLAKEPNSHLALILKSKYHPDTSIWRAKPNRPKSAFWAAILKVQPLLKSAAFYQIIDGSASIWSSPWFSGWEEIHDNLIIQPHPFTYPAIIRDLWLPNQNLWNVNLIQSLFEPQTAEQIISTPIIKASGQDNLCWKLTPRVLISIAGTIWYCQQVNSLRRYHPKSKTCSFMHGRTRN
jgi:hypothetical protein